MFSPSEMKTAVASLIGRFSSTSRSVASPITASWMSFFTASSRSRRPSTPVTRQPLAASFVARAVPNEPIPSMMNFLPDCAMGFSR